MENFERYERNKGNKETWGMEIEGNYSPLNFSGTFRIMSNKLYAMYDSYYTIHKQMSEKHIFSLLPFLFRPLFSFLFSPVFFAFLYCFFRYFVRIFPVVFFLLLLSPFFQDKLKGLCEKTIFLCFTFCGGHLLLCCYT